MVAPTKIEHSVEFIEARVPSKKLCCGSPEESAVRLVDTGLREDEAPVLVSVLHLIPGPG